MPGDTGESGEGLEAATVPNTSGEVTGELKEDRLESLRESASLPTETPKASELLDRAAAQAHEDALASEGSTKSIARDSLVELLKVEVKETEGAKPRQFGILKHTATRDEERLERLEDEDEETRLNIDPEALAKLRTPMDEEDEDPTTAVPQDTLEALKASVESPHSEITREREAPDPQVLLPEPSEELEGESALEGPEASPEPLARPRTPTPAPSPSLASDDEVLEQMGRRPWGPLLLMLLLFVGLIALVVSVAMSGNP